MGTEGTDIYSILRKIAKSNFYQTVFSMSKESPIWVFDNNKDFSEIQLTFMSFLAFYHSINMDIGMGEVTDRVLNNSIYEDAYCYYRNQERKKSTKEKQQKSSSDTTKRVIGKDKIEEKSEFKWVFRSPRKKNNG